MLKNFKHPFDYRVTVQSRAGNFLARHASPLFRRLVICCLKLVGGLMLLGVVVLRPIVTIRFGALHSARVGTLISTADYWLRNRSLKYATNRGSRRCIDVFVAAPHIAPNRYLLRMIARRLPLIRSRLANSIYYATRAQFPDSGAWLDFGQNGRDDHEIWHRTTSSLLYFTDDEIKRGQALLQSLGIGSDEPFICFAARDNAFLNSFFPPEKQNPPRESGHWHYDDFRNSDIESYRLAAEWLAGRGYWMLRMGAAVEKPIAWENPRIIDYATHHRSEFGDIFLMGNCRFFIGDSMGIYLMSSVFNVPVAHANLVPWFIPARSALTLFVPKKFRKISDGRLLSFPQAIKAGVDMFTFYEQYEKAGIEPVANSPEEILGMAIELDARIEETWKPAPDDEEVQQDFWSLLPAEHPAFGSRARVTVDFLRRNRELFRASPKTGSS